MEPEQALPSMPTGTGSATPTIEPDRVDRGWIAFAADSMAGPDLSTPVDFGLAEGSPTDMDIYVVREGGAVRRIVGTAAHERCPAFSPDGTRLAYVESPADGIAVEAAIVVTRFDPDAESVETQLRVPLYPSNGYGPWRGYGPICPRWSPDGTRIAFRSTGTMNVLPGGGTPHLSVISALDGRTVIESQVSAADISGFAWSPDGQEIAYAVGPPPNIPVGSHLSVLRVDGGAERALWTAQDATELGRVAWSPGENIAVVASTTVPTGPNSASGSVSVLMGPADGSRELQPVVGVSPAGYVGSWSPDGGTLAVATETGVAIVGSDGRTNTEVGVSGEDGGLLRPSGVMWSPDGQRLLATVRTPTDARSAPGVASFALDGSSVDLLTPYTWAFNWVAPDDLSWQPIP
jgi:Tol biopolymer transport system component